MSRTNLTDAVVVITGGARGIGRATAASFAARGARVVIGDLDRDEAVSVAGELSPAAIGLRLDVTSHESFAAFIDEVEHRIGPIDVLVNNAGIMPVGAFVDNELTTVRAVIDVNLWGVALGCHLVLPGMIARRRGQVINIASALGRVAGGGVAAYSATKFGVVGLTHALQQEVRGTGVVVTAVLPGVVRTELSSGVSEAGVPVAQPTDVADAILRACDNRSAEVAVPRGVGPIMRILASLPPRMLQPLLRRANYHRALTGVDDELRAGYRDRLSRIETQLP
jgi:NAD(P)-dependent dehydrogenase (short-subunit alcohol dehydrogenase family)